VFWLSLIYYVDQNKLARLLMSVSLTDDVSSKDKTETSVCASVSTQNKSRIMIKGEFSVK